MVAFGQDPNKRIPNNNHPLPLLRWLPLYVLLMSGCGGGGGGGGSSLTQPTLTAPPPTSRIGSSETSNSPGLRLIAASHLYDHGKTGAGSTIAVLDSGVDENHKELINRVDGGGDWQGNTRGVSDPNGHGTHVASIAAAARDGEGMQGIAPSADIISYRILNAAGIFGGKTGNAMLPPIIADINRRGVKIINNSWASFYEITDFPKSIIDTALDDEIRSYRNSISATGPVYVWAAGNGGENNVSIRSGLPHFYPELEKNWITVVAVDQFGREPSYTNRCGTSVAWCITAPGGGDDEANYGIIGARAGGDYVKKSGTSMAAPLVSGALSLVMEAMPTITPYEAATRLKQTATLDGLTTASGCTIQHCSEAEMRAVFGMGLLNVDGALSPIGAASVITDQRHKTSWVGSTITTPTIIGPALERGLDGAVAVIHDSFDQAIMVSALSPLLHMPAPPLALPSVQSPSVITAPLAAGFFISPSGSAPPPQHSKAQLIDVPSAPTDTWQGWQFTTEGGRGNVKKTQQLMTGHGDGRHVIHFMQSHDYHRRDGGVSSHWYGIGMDKTEGWMDGISKGAVNTGGSTAQWVFLGVNHTQGAFELTAETLMGKTDLTGADNSLIQGGQIIYDSLALHSIIHAGQFDLGLSLVQPPALRRGYITIDQPQRISAERIDFVAQRFDLSLANRERQLALHAEYQPFATTSLNFTAEYLNNHGHQSGQNGAQFTIQFTQAF